MFLIILNKYFGGNAASVSFKISWLQDRKLHYFDNWVIIFPVFLKHQMPNVQVPAAEHKDLMHFFVICESEVNFFGFQTVLLK